MQQEVAVRDNPARSRYELLLDGVVSGELSYRRVPGGIALTHAGVDPARQGRGLGVRLVAGALADLRVRDLRVVPVCPFVVWFMRRHPGFDDLRLRGDDSPHVAEAPASRSPATRAPDRAESGR